MDEKMTVVVLMSTYNGAEYLDTQIQSILAQTGVEVRLFVRDDGSTDGTVDILDRYMRQGQLEYYVGDNVGYVRSFHDLVRMAPKAEFYAFSDQDDLWQPTKLSRGVEQIHAIQSPALYCSNSYRWHGDDPLTAWHDATFYTNLESLLIWPIIQGCTYVFNRQLVEIVRSHQVNYADPHDTWLMLAAAIFGQVIYDPVPSMKYRIHDHQFSNIQSSPLRRKLFNLKEFIFPPGNIESQRAAHLMECFGASMPVESRKAVAAVADYRKSAVAWARLLLSRGQRSASIMRLMRLKMKILLRQL